MLLGVILALGALECVGSDPVLNGPGSTPPSTPGPSQGDASPAVVDAGDAQGDGLAPDAPCVAAFFCEGFEGQAPRGWSSTQGLGGTYASASIVVGGAHSGEQYWKVTSQYDGVLYVEKNLVGKSPASVVASFAFTIDTSPSGFVTIMRI